MVSSQELWSEYCTSCKELVRQKKISVWNEGLMIFKVIGKGFGRFSRRSATIYPGYMWG